MTDTTPQRFEVIVLPVSDVDRSLVFYRDVMGWNLDVDHAPTDEFRVVQLTPPGSAASVTFGIGLGYREDGPRAGTYQGMHLCTPDVPRLRDELIQRGADVSDVTHVGPDGQQAGPHPERADFGTYATVADPDGNVWVLQEVGHDAVE